MKQLIVYFSYSGNTRRIVNEIKIFHDYDTLEIETVIPYSQDYDEVVNHEHNQEASQYLPAIKDIHIDLTQYDTIIIGTPVWWYRPAPAIRTFLNQNDLSGKTIKMFATNAGWLGRTFQEITSLCKGAHVDKGFNIVFEAYSDHLKTDIKDIHQWIQTL